jgi:hypothetical protein
MKRNRHYLIVPLLAGSAFGDTILLKNGTSISGALVNMDAREIGLKRCGRVEYFAKDDVNSIQVQPVAGPEVCAGARSKVELPSGFSIRAQMTEHVDSLREPRGQVFLGRLEQPVTVDDRIVVPRGARLLVELIELGDATRSLNLIAIELRKSSWIRLDEKISPQPLTAAKVDSKDLRGERILVPSGKDLEFVLNHAITLDQ